MCELIDLLGRAIKRRASKTSKPLAPEEDCVLCVGILGMGHLGKLLLLALPEKTDIKPSHIKISTRRPELAEVLFFCCLPAHLPNVRADLCSHLPKHCLVYSFTSAVPVPRLAKLLRHNYILKPQYDFAACDTADVWQSCPCVATGLSDPFLIEALCPLTLKGGISLGLNWVCAVFYSLLNSCTSASLGSSEAFSLINLIFKEKWPNSEQLKAFPWISLTDAQMKETPLLRFLSSSKSVQQCITAAYKSHMETPAK